MFVTVSSIQANSISDFKIENLSVEGRQAYTTLFNARTFSIGFVGWIAEQSANEKALRVLLKEKKAKEALVNLVHNATPEGSLYGLFGLRMNNLKSFNRELKYCKSKPEPLERKRNPEKAADIFNTISAGEVVIQKGCVIRNAQLKEVINSIETGIYDEEFRLNRTGIEYIITTTSCGSKGN